MKRFALIVPLTVALALLSYEMLYFNITSNDPAMPQMPIWIILIIDLTILCFGFNMLSYSAKMVRGGWLYRAIFFLLLGRGHLSARTLSVHAPVLGAPGGRYVRGGLARLGKHHWGALFKRMVGPA